MNIAISLIFALITCPITSFLFSWGVVKVLRIGGFEIALEESLRFPALLLNFLLCFNLFILILGALDNASSMW